MRMLNQEIVHETLCQWDLNQNGVYSLVVYFTFIHKSGHLFPLNAICVSNVLATTGHPMNQHINKLGIKYGCIPRNEIIHLYVISSRVEYIVLTFPRSVDQCR